MSNSTTIFALGLAIGIGISYAMSSLKEKTAGDTGTLLSFEKGEDTPTLQARYIYILSPFSYI